MLALRLPTVHWFNHILGGPATKLLAPHDADGPLGFVLVKPVFTRLVAHFSYVYHVIKALELVIEEGVGPPCQYEELTGGNTSGYDPSKAFWAGSIG